MLKKLLCVLLAASSSVVLTACNERQVATGAAVVGGALVAGAIANSYNRNRYYDNYYYGDGYYYRNRGYYGYDYYSDGYYYGRRGYGGRWWGTSNEVTSDTDAKIELAATPKNEVRADQALAKQYDMPVRAAKNVLNVFEHVKATGSLEKLRAMGVSQNELQAIANGANPTAETVSAVSTSIGASTNSVNALFAAFAREYAKAQNQRSL